MFGIFDSRPKHSSKPFLLAVGNGRFSPAVYDTVEQAEAMAAKMNAVSRLTTYIVKGVK